MKQERMDVLKESLKHWEVDIEAGTVKTRKGIASYIDKCGYVRVSTKKNGKVTMFGVHEVIAYVAGLDILNKEVNHIDGNKQNNNYKNLEAVTRKENIIHAFRTGLNKPNKGSKHGCSILTEEQVTEIRNELNTNYYHGIGKALAEKYGVHPATISAIRKERLWV